MNEQAAVHHASKFTSKQRTIALVIVALAFVMDLLDSTIVNIAIPSIQANLHASYTAIQWLVAGYSLTFALLLITGGRMGDVFGYKKIFLLGMGGFTVASFLSGIAGDPLFLIFARLLQGSMAALMVPQVMSLMQVMYKPNERGNVMGLFGMLGGLSASLGPVLGGFLIKANLFGWDWRPIFLINIPVGIAGFLLAMKFLPQGKSAHPLHLDVKGTLMILVALSLLIFPLIQGRDLDWPTWIFAMMAASIPFFALFAWYERRKMGRDGSALIVPSLFKKRTFVSGLALNIIFEAIMIGFFLSFTLTLQAGLGFDPLKAAVTGIPTAIGIGLSIALLGQKLVPRFGRYVITAGTVVFAIGLLLSTWVVSHYGLDAQSWYFIPGLFIIGLGMGGIMSPMFSVALQDVDVQHAGAASGVLNAVQQVGAAVGIAVIGVIFFGQLSSGAYTAFDRVSPKLRDDLTALHVPAQAQNAIVSGVRTCFHDRSTQKDASVVPDSCKQAEAQPNNAVAQKIKDTITAAGTTANANNFSEAYKSAVMYVLVVTASIFGLSFALPRKFRVVEAA